MRLLSQTRKVSISEFRTSQNLRLLDVFVFAPATFIIGMNPRLHPALRIFFLAEAGFILLTDGKRYLENERIYKEYLKTGATGDIDEIQKTNLVRAENIILFSPLLIYAVTRKDVFQKSIARYSIPITASASILYNGYYWAKSIQPIKD